MRWLLETALGLLMAGAALLMVLHVVSPAVLTCT